MRIAGYIFGDNSEEIQIDMTAPVIFETNSNHKYNEGVMSFMMPKKSVE